MTQPTAVNSFSCKMVSCHSMGHVDKAWHMTQPTALTAYFVKWSAVTAWAMQIKPGTLQNQQL